MIARSARSGQSLSSRPDSRTNGSARAPSSRRSSPRISIIRTLPRRSPPDSSTAPRTSRRNTPSAIRSTSCCASAGRCRFARSWRSSNRSPRHRSRRRAGRPPRLAAPARHHAVGRRGAHHRLRHCRRVVERSARSCRRGRSTPPPMRRRTCIHSARSRSRRRPVSGASADNLKELEAEHGSALREPSTLALAADPEMRPKRAR